MNAKDLKPASALALRLGVKMLNYGPPGSGKTPIVNTAPRPVLCVTEPGMLSMRTSTVPAWEAYSVNKIKEFFEWSLNSTEMKNFDTICIDSISQMAETYLTEAKTKYAHGQQAYGKMAEDMMNWITKLYYLPNKHIYLTGKLDVTDGEKRPYFPGKELNVKVPHLYDIIGYMDFATIPSIGTVKAIRCQPMFGLFARDRSGNLSKYEEPNLTKLFTKAML